MRRHFREAPAAAFRIRSGGLSEDALQYAIRYLSARVQLMPGDFTTHSLRRRWGSIPEDLRGRYLGDKRKGGMASDAVFEYLKM